MNIIWARSLVSLALLAVLSAIVGLLFGLRVALGFALEQLRHDFRELEQCVTEDARSTMGTDLKRAN